MPEIIKLLKKEDDIILLNNIFEHFEEVCNSGDNHLIDNFSVTVLEILGDDESILDLAQKYTRSKTKQLLFETIQNM